MLHVDFDGFLFAVSVRHMQGQTSPSVAKLPPPPAAHPGAGPPPIHESPQDNECSLNEANLSDSTDDTVGSWGSQGWSEDRGGAALHETRELTPVGAVKGEQPQVMPTTKLVSYPDPLGSQPAPPSSLPSPPKPLVNSQWPGDLAPCAFLSFLSNQM